MSLELDIERVLERLSAAQVEALARAAATLATPDSSLNATFLGAGPGAQGSRHGARRQAGRAPRA